MDWRTFSILATTAVKAGTAIMKINTGTMGKGMAKIGMLRSTGTITMIMNSGARTVPIQPSQR